MQRIVHRDEQVDIDGKGFTAIERLQLNQFLQRLCSEAGVTIEYLHTITSRDDLQACDLLVPADGANSVVRRGVEGEFKPQAEGLKKRFGWYGTAPPFEWLALTFRAYEDGDFVAPPYRHHPAM